jgi:hypothetical protein
MEVLDILLVYRVEGVRTDEEKKRHTIHVRVEDWVEDAPDDESVEKSVNVQVAVSELDLDFWT